LQELEQSHVLVDFTRLGGADLDDVSNLLTTTRSLPYADTTDTFMYGVSRGGMMMTLLEMKRNLQFKAAAVVGAVYDLTARRTGTSVFAKPQS
jgi:dipeptidyl aminopeptidase/acylaminoacyl peptidase